MLENNINAFVNLGEPSFNYQRCNCHSLLVLLDDNIEYHQFTATLYYNRKYEEAFSRKKSVNCWMLCFYDLLQYLKKYKFAYIDNLQYNQIYT